MTGIDLLLAEGAQAIAELALGGIEQLVDQVEVGRAGLAHVRENEGTQEYL